MVQTKIGISQEQDAKTAVEQALAGCISESQLPDLTIIFFAGDYQLQAVWEACSNVLKGSPFIGGRIAAIFTADQVYQQGVAALSLYGISARTKLTALDNEQAYKDGQNVGPALADSSERSGAVLMLPPVGNIRISALIRGIYANLGPNFQYFGGGTSGQFTEAGFTYEGLAAALVKDVYFSHRVGHGWMPFGEPMLVTRAERNRIYELDGQPAVKRYRDVIQQVLDQDVDITDHKYQLGIPCGRGEYVVRDVIRVEDQTLVCIAEIPSKSLVSLMTTSLPALPAIAKRITEEALTQHPAPQFAIIFDCCSREHLQKENFRHESQNIYLVLGELPTLGVLCFGAINSPFGVPLYYNKALSVTIGGESR